MPSLKMLSAVYFQVSSQLVKINVIKDVIYYS